MYIILVYTRVASAYFQSYKLGFTLYVNGGVQMNNSPKIISTSESVNFQQKPVGKTSFVAVSGRKLEAVFSLRNFGIFFWWLLVIFAFYHQKMVGSHPKIFEHLLVGILPPYFGDIWCLSVGTDPYYLT